MLSLRNGSTKPESRAILTIFLYKMSSPPKIAIIGAGPAGTTLARLLHLASIPVTIFEGEVTPSIRMQGGTLDLHSGTGLAAVEKAGLLGEYKKYARYDGEALTIADKNLNKYLEMEGATEDSSTGRPEIDREQLRKILIESLPEGCIKWGCRLKSVDENLALHFEHGVETGFDLLVGADGAWSKVRPLVSDVKPFYCGMGGMDLFIDDAEHQVPDLHKLVNRGSLFSYTDGNAIFAQQKGDGTIVVYAWTVRDEDWIKKCGYDVKNAAEVRKALAVEYEGWTEQLVKFTQVANEDRMIARSLYMLPVGHRWENRPGVTLLGDAAHLMTPFAGEGVNVAMDDAMKLAHAITESMNSRKPNALNEGVKAFEEEMFERATKVQERTRLNMIDTFFTPGAPASIINNFISRMAGPE